VINFLEMRNRLMSASLAVGLLASGCSKGVEEKKDAGETVAENNFYLSDLEVCELKWEYFYEQEICVRARLKDYDVKSYHVPKLSEWSVALEGMNLEKSVQEDVKMRVLLTVAEYSGQCSRVKKEVDCIDEVRYLLLQRSERVLKNKKDPAGLFMYFYVLDSLIDADL
jgi:hypothetical protein